MVGKINQSCGDPRQRRKRGEKQREGRTKRVKKYEPGGESKRGEEREEKRGEKEEGRDRGEKGLYTGRFGYSVFDLIDCPHSAGGV